MGHLFYVSAAAVMRSHEESTPSRVPEKSEWDEHQNASVLLLDLPRFRGRHCSHSFIFSIYPTFLCHYHSLHLAYSDINLKRRVKLAPFRSLHKFLLINQKVL
jgi:hypothetical protein